MAIQIGIWSFMADLNWIECAVTLGGQSIPALLYQTIAGVIDESQALYPETSSTGSYPFQ
jgi:hypothetical protein